MTDSIISIAHAAAPQEADTGDFIYRVRSPDAAMGALPGAQTFSLTTACVARESIMREADVLVIQMLGDPDLLPVITDRKRRRRLTVFEVSDNFLAFQKHNPAAAFYEDPAARALLLQYLSMCHAAQMSVPELLKRFSSYNPRCVVFLNSAGSVKWPKRPEAPLTVGWGGSSGHFEDIKNIAPALVEWLKRNSDVRLSIMSDARIAALFSAVPKSQLKTTSPGSLDKYCNFLESLHIGLAPLSNHEFNLCRSDVKFLEYASRGVVPVCSDVCTYSTALRDGETGFLFSSTENMIQILDSLAADAGLRGRIARAAFEYAINERSPENDARARLDYYRNLIRENDLEIHGPLEAPTRLPQSKKTRGTNHYFIDFGSVERNLHDGLMAQFRNNDANTAAILLKRAVDAAPECAHAHFFYANAMLAANPEQAESHMRLAAELNPDACAAPLILARMEMARGDMDAAGSILTSIQKRNPDFSPAYAIEADIHKAAGRTDLAIQCLEKALNANPFDAPAAARAAAIWLESGKPERARPLFENAASLCPHIAAYYLGLGAALHALGETAGALASMERAVECNPQLDDAANYLRDAAKLEYKSGSMSAAVEILSNLNALRPNDADTAFWLARALERMGDATHAHVLWNFLAYQEYSGKHKNIAIQKLNPDTTKKITD